MPKPLRYTLFLLLWLAIAGYVGYSLWSDQRYRRQLTVKNIDIEIADSSAQGQLVTSQKIRQWIDRSGIQIKGKKFDQVDLSSIEAMIRKNGFVADVSAVVNYEGVLRISVHQRDPQLRILLDGYNAYCTREGYIFSAPSSSALYVPVITGTYTPPVPSNYNGLVLDYISQQIELSRRRMDEIEQEKYPIFRQEQEEKRIKDSICRMRVSKWFKRQERFEQEVTELRAEKVKARRRYRYNSQLLQQRIDHLSAQQNDEEKKQKKLRKSYEDFMKLLTFVELVEEDDFWRSEIVQIVVSKNTVGEPELELIPRVGSHVVLFGSPDGAEEKLSKLLKFYQKGLNNIGWEEYKTINVQYDKQVVCTK
jgi:hypothetical protein